MPNIKDATIETTPNTILALGNTGSGKTALAMTHPGRKFAYFFDGNAINTAIKFKKFKDFDLDYEIFTPKRLSLDAGSLKKGLGDRASQRKTSNLYLEWERNFEDKCEKGFFNDYDCLIMDGLTTFGDMVMDRILTINGRFGQWPQEDDWGPQMCTIANVFREVTNCDMDLIVPGHLTIKQDNLSKRIFQMPLTTGNLRQKLPTLFAQIWVLEANTDERSEKVNYTIQTMPDRLTPNIRNTIEGLDFKHDVTIDFTKPTTCDQGLGKILKHVRRISHAA